MAYQADAGDGLQALAIMLESRRLIEVILNRLVQPLHLVFQRSVIRSMDGLT